MKCLICQDMGWCARTSDRPWEGPHGCDCGANVLPNRPKFINLYRALAAARGEHSVPRSRRLFDEAVCARLIILPIAFAGHSRSAHTTELFMPSQVRVVFADPPEAKTN